MTPPPADEPSAPGVAVPTDGVVVFVDAAKGNDSGSGSQTSPVCTDPYFNNERHVAAQYITLQHSTDTLWYNSANAPSSERRARRTDPGDSTDTKARRVGGRNS